MDDETKRLLKQWLHDLERFEKNCESIHKYGRNDCPTWQVWERIDEVKIYIEGLK